jgi:hypothetical protein
VKKPDLGLGDLPSSEAFRPTIPTARYDRVDSESDRVYYIAASGSTRLSLLDGGAISNAAIARPIAHSPWRARINIITLFTSDAQDAVGVHCGAPPWPSCGF